MGVELPRALLAGPHAGGIVNLPAVIVALAIAGLLVAGTRESATLNIVLVVIKMTALAAFVLLALAGIRGGQPATVHATWIRQHGRVRTA